MYEHLTKHNLLSIHQSGFHPYHSCDTALIKLTDSLVTNMDKGLISGLNLTDYRKAFDLVGHATLFKKLSIYGISGRSPQWFNWYLNDRKQRVMIQRRLSSPQSTTTGVPQGSILGPLLFILFVNDLPLDVSKSTVKIYADDTTQVAFGRTVKEVETILTHELRLLSRRADETKTVLNHSKTKSIIVWSKPKFRGLDGENLETIKANMIL